MWCLSSKTEIVRLGTRTPSEHVGPRNDGARSLMRGRDHTGAGVGTFGSTAEASIMFQKFINIIFDLMFDNHTKIMAPGPR